jgi:protein-disulfide isomerase
MRYLLCLLLLLASSLTALADSPASASSQTPTKAPVIVPLGDSPSRGAADAPVVMIEFIDFQ